MRGFIRKLIKFTAYVSAGIVILLAIAVGLFRLFLPRLPEYQEEIKDWASTAIGVQVEFSGMDARWGLSGPELEFYEAELIRPDSEIRIIAAEEVRVGVGLIRLIADRTLVVDRVVVRESSIEVRQLEDGEIWIQGSRVSELLELRPANATTPSGIDVIGEDLELSFMQPGDERPQFFEVPNVRVSVDERRIAADGSVNLPDALGRGLQISATQLLGVPEDERSWDVSVDANDVSLPGWSEMSGLQRQFASGIGDLELALVYADGAISNATADLDFVDVALVEDEYFDLSGRVEVNLSRDGWLVAANDFFVATEDQQWPRSVIRLETSTDRDGSIVMVDAIASYVDLGHLEIITPLLTAEYVARIESLQLDGIVRNLEATISDLDSNEPRFNVNAELDGIGVAAQGNIPGVRGFSGKVRASHSGGAIEIAAADLEVDSRTFLGSVIDVSTSDAMVFWRQRENELSIWSDGLQLSNDFMNSFSDIDLVFRDGQPSPEIALTSTWSIADLAEAKTLIPRSITKPVLYDWFQMALVSGSISHGTTELRGPLDKFPFDGGDGRLLINASVRNLEFKYHRDWPAASQSNLEVVLDNVRLYSQENRSDNAGNVVIDANVDIPDLRDPVLRIQSTSVGTLESIRQFSMQSPISSVFGNQLDRFTVAGDASFSLDLLVPLRRERVAEFEFVSRIRSNNGSLRIEGFRAPVTDIVGDVTVSRDAISSESLGGTFLGQPVSIDLSNSTDPMFTIVATATSTLTEDGTINGLGLPFEGMVSGETPYIARVLFPSSKIDNPAPLTIQVESAFEGYAFNLPAPVGKDAATTMQMRGDIRFHPGGELIESFGYTDSQVAWQLAFNRPEGFWDLDRGVVALGDDVMPVADTRGLHIRGKTDLVVLRDWLNLSRAGEGNVGVADRIRSIDVEIERLILLGLQLDDHRVKVDRSARDWLVQFDGDSVAGSAFVPYEFGTDRAMVLDMQKMHLSGADSESPEGSNLAIDPRTFSPIELRAADFAFGNRHLGAVEMNVEKTADGLNASLVKASDETFDVAAIGRWVFDPNDPMLSRSFVTGVLTSTHVMETMRRLDYEPGIDSDEMSIQFDLEWSGNPRADFFDVLDGEVQVSFGPGQLEEVEPGAGRMFGLMSVAALPRRLSLDFSDVFNKGFGFDKIRGNFRIEDGKTYTCDLALESPAANVGIVGEADIVDRTYAQTAIVSANVGNTLPIVGAVVAGPQVAAALLIFSQIFKKPLQEAGQVYYGIDGSWDEPTVEPTDSDRFVISSSLAGCLADAE